MFDSIKRLLKKMSCNNKQCPEIKIAGHKIIPDNMKRTEVVLPGHYCSRDTLKSEVKEIIRVIGPDRERTGYWITQDGKSLHESTILDSYVPLDTKATTDKSRKDSIMSGLTTITLREPVEPELEQPIYSEVPKVNNVVEDKFYETRKLIEKASIESLNKNYQEKYGTQPYKPINIRIPFDIQIGYELNKLAQICELFDINTHEVAELIYRNITLPKQEIINVIENQLRQTTIVPIFDNPKPAEKEDIVGTGISEVDDYLSKMFNKK